MKKKKNEKLVLGHCGWLNYKFVGKNGNFTV